MISTSWRIACLVAVACAGTSVAMGQAPPARVDGCGHWGMVSYPRLQVGSGATERSIWTFIANRCDLGGLLLVFAVTERRGGDPMESPIPKPKATGTLHTEDGTAIEPDPCPLESPEQRPGLSKGALFVSSVTWYHYFLFAWQEKPLQQAWVEVRAGDGTYWLELPYGLMAKPDDQLPAAVRGGDRGPYTEQVASPPEGMSPASTLLPWRGVSYDVGGEQTRWSVSARLSNSFDPECELSIRPLRDSDLHDPEEWSLHRPSMAVVITDVDGTVRDGHATSVSFHEEGRERRGTFRFPRYIKAGRCWGTLTVYMGDDQYSVKVPSSLYRSWHGHSRRAGTHDGQSPPNPGMPDTER